MEEVYQGKSLDFKLKSIGVDETGAYALVETRLFLLPKNKRDIHTYKTNESKMYIGSTINAQSEEITRIHLGHLNTGGIYILYNQVSNLKD